MSVSGSMAGGRPVSSRSSRRGDSGGDVLSEVPSLLEALYDEEPTTQLRGAAGVLRLAQQYPARLGALAQHPTLLGALARVLREDGRKSADLAAATLRTFLAFSAYTDFHVVLMAHRVGDACLRLLELEVRRLATRTAELSRLEALAALQAAGDDAGERALRAADAARRQQEAVAAPAGPGEGGAATGGITTVVPLGAAADASAAAAQLRHLKPLPLGRVDASRERLRSLVLARKQEGVLGGCLMLLRHLADDVGVERKMCSRGIVGLLLPLLAHPCQPVAVLALAFLRKLSIFEENKDAMAAQGAPTALVALLRPPAAPAPDGSATPPDDGAAAASAAEVRVGALRLLYNLCFDGELRTAIVAQGAAAAATALLRRPPYRAAALPLLYHMSQDPAHVPALAAAGAPALVLKLAVAFPQDRLPPELAALAVNLTAHSAVAATLLGAEPAAGSGAPTGGGVIGPLVARAVRSGDPFAVKILRGLAWHSYTVQAAACDAAAAAQEATFASLVEDERHKECRRQRAALRGDDGADDDGAEDGDDGEPAGPVDYGLMPDEPVPYEYAHDGVWAPHVRELVRVAVSAAASPAPTARHLLAEALGLLSCITPRDMGPAALSWGSYAGDPGFVGVLAAALGCCPPLPHDADDDVLMGGLQLLGGLALDPDTAEPLARALSLGPPLATVLAQRRGDVDVLLQAACAIGRLLHHHPTRAALVAGDEHVLPLCVAELLTHPDPGVVSEAAALLGVMLDALAAQLGRDAPLVAHLRARRFTAHNREWVAAVAAEEARERAAAAVAGRPGTASGGRRPGTATAQRRMTPPGSVVGSALLVQQHGDDTLQQPGGGAGGGSTETGSRHPSAVAAEAYRRLGLEALKAGGAAGGGSRCAVARPSSGSGGSGRDVATGFSELSGGGAYDDDYDDDDVSAGDGVVTGAGGREWGAADDDEGDDDADGGSVHAEVRAMMERYRMVPSTGTLDLRQREPATPPPQLRPPTTSSSGSSRSAGSSASGVSGASGNAAAATGPGGIPRPAAGAPLRPSTSSTSLSVGLWGPHGRGAAATTVTAGLGAGGASPGIRPASGGDRTGAGRPSTAGRPASAGRRQ